MISLPEGPLPSPLPPKFASILYGYVLVYATLSHALSHRYYSFHLESTNRSSGQPVSHGFAKELLAGFVGGEVDKLAETKGMDFYDKEKAQHRAKKGAEQMYDDHYGDMDQYNPERRDRPNFRY